MSKPYDNITALRDGETAPELFEKKKYLVIRQNTESRGN